MKKNVLNTLSFLFPSKVIRSKKFSKNDVRHIKENLALSLGNIYLIAAIVLFVLVAGLFIYQNVKTNFRFPQIYGFASFIAYIMMMSGSLLSIILLVLSKITGNRKRSIIYARIGGDVLFVCSATYMLLCILADAQMGFISKTESLSAAIIFVAVLVLIQQMFWADALILDIATSIGLITLSIICAYVYKIQAVYYYIMVALVFPLASYMVVSLLFFAESQKYKEALENERLYNHAYYDSLTHCKNRHYLNRFLKENKARWNNKDNINLLTIIFDIDDFRLYNTQFSHLGGDYCLRSLCDAVRREFISPNLDFFRYGGEEFLLFFEVSDENEAIDNLKRLQSSISNLKIIAPTGAVKDHVTVSIGATLVKGTKGFDFQENMKIIDGYLYQAKEAGKDVICYNGSMLD